MKYTPKTKTIQLHESVDIPKGSICIESRRVVLTAGPAVIVSWLELVVDDKNAVSKKKVRK